MSARSECTKGGSASPSRPGLADPERSWRDVIYKVLLIAFACLAGAPVAAQEADDFRRCVDVEIGGERAAYGCINQFMRRKVEQAGADRLAAPLAAGSQDIRVGTVNIPAVRQQYGRNFGLSVIPERPPLIYSSPLAPRQ